MIDPFIPSSDNPITLDRDDYSRLLDKISKLMEQATEVERLLTKAAHIINHPQKAGPKWATYSRPHVQKVVDDISAFLDRNKP